MFLESFVTITDNAGVTHNVNLSNVTDITYLKDGSFGEIHFTNDRQILFVPSQHPFLSSRMAQVTGVVPVNGYAAMIPGEKPLPTAKS
jgi:hypothetical protein